MRLIHCFYYIFYLFKHRLTWGKHRMVPVAGLEPAHPKAVDFESTASTNFATLAIYVEALYAA